MSGKANLPHDHNNRSYIRGSAEKVPTRYDALDQERAASMTDEGGASGFELDRFRQSKTTSRAVPWTLLAVGAGAVSVAALTWFAIRQFTKEERV